VSPDSPTPAFHVDWPAEPTRGLANAFSAYFPSRQGIRVTRAEQIIEYLLGDDPERNGELVSEGLYRLTVSPLRVQYEILPLNRVVRVLSAGFFPV
jgi:hypothetical protein